MVLNINRYRHALLKLKADFGIAVNIEGFAELSKELSESLDYDVEVLSKLNKDCILWSTYLADLSALLSSCLEQYKNVCDIYAYLRSISISNTDAFCIEAPKYRIDTRSVPAAIQQVEEKQREFQTIIKEIQLLHSDIEAFREFARSNYFKTSKLLRGVLKREQNNAF